MLISTGFYFTGFNSHSSLSSGRTSHKSGNKNPILALYYYKTVLFTLCAGNEGMFLGFYLVHFTSNFYVTSFLYLCLPFGILKQFMNVVQLIQAFVDLNELDMAERKAKK
eukprot:TRINITY_DN3610_c0_g1_i2.p2 TRINITY_DN3610_c0_g1~~TRINITY_DN3610_c0_g1_i2.p2  ORF type:complete len:110 (-),score=18.40 TRINITY_DN3610_c0_g1_i2:45-374(-)